jgi:multidrug efflux system membrane fusion protein
MNINLLKYTALLSMVILVSCSEKETEEKASIRPVAYLEVGLSENDFSRTFSGTATTDKVVNLSFRNNGIITEFNLKLGQVVDKGELLAKLDNVQARLNYENSLSSLNSAESQMNTAKLSLDRVRYLFEKGSSSLSDYEAAKNAYRAAEASYESAVRGVSIQKEQVSYGYLYAPDDGVIAQVNAEIDENVSAGQIIAVLNEGSEMKIAMGLPENVINQVTKGMKVKVEISSLKEETFEGEISEVSPSIDPQNSTYPVSVRILNASEGIKSGMAANVTFQFSEAAASKESLIIPAASVGEDNNGNFVFLIDDSDEKVFVKKQVIKIGELTSRGFEITEGLKVGNKIAVAGLQTLLDGQEVRLQ